MRISQHLTWLPEDIWVGYSHSSSEITSSVLSFKLPGYKLGLLGLQHNKHKAELVIWHKTLSNSDSWAWSVREYKRRDGYKNLTWNTVLARTRSVRWSRAWAFRLPDESISPINAGASWGARRDYDATYHHEKFHNCGSWYFEINFMLDLVFAVIIRLKMLHVKSIVWRTNSA